MSQDLTYIRNELKGFCEIDSPYEIKKGEILKLITIEKGDEYFYSGKYIRMLNNKVVIDNNGSNKYVKLKIFDKGGNMLYKTRLFIKDDNENDCVSETDKKEYEEIIKTQQDIIEKMSQQNNKYKMIIQELHEKNMKYELTLKKIIENR